MRSVTYSMGVSLDGYIVGPDGGFDWTTPDAEVSSAILTCLMARYSHNRPEMSRHRSCISARPGSPLGCNSLPPVQLSP